MTERETTNKTHVKRKHPWLRRVGVVVGFLLAGAIINVLVAWGCAIWAKPASVPRLINDGMTEKVRIGGDDFLYVEGTWAGSRWRMLSWTRPRPSVTEQSPDGPWHQLHRLYAKESYGFVFAKEHGWPLRSLCGAAFRRQLPQSELIMHGAIPISDTSPNLMPHDSPYFTTLPLVPHPISFMINSVIYALALSIPIAVSTTIRETHRRQRGLCPDCGYDLRAADHGKCPECGEAVKAGNVEKSKRQNVET